jgi:hypothetical protein
MDGAVLPNPMHNPSGLRALRRPFVLSLLCVSVGCTGTIGGDDPSEPGGGDADGPTAEVLSQIGVSGARRLTATEYDATVELLLGVTGVDSELMLPEDLRSPFDNDYTEQKVSEALINSVELLAGQLAAEVIADASLRSKIVPCEPSGPADEACFRDFVASFGRRALRRPLAEEEIDRFVTALFGQASVTGDFWAAVDSALRAFLQHPEMLYRIEVGTPVDGEAGIARLTDWELAARLSFFLWGTTTPDWLLDQVEAGGLADTDGVRAAVDGLMADERALARLARFHSMWMGYEKLPHEAELSQAMQQETEELLRRVLFEEQSPWVDLLRAEETYLTPALASHYGLPEPSETGWVPYGDSGRRGLLSQGSFLSAVAKFDDTSPVQRGLLIRTRLFCQEISLPPPELMVNTDEPPEGPDPNACKDEQYVMWKTDGCKTCHSLLEPVGFGLENYDSAGRYREVEPGKPECAIDGSGKLEGVGEFTGPAELSDLMIEAGQIDACVAKQLYRFVVGRFELDEFDKTLVDAMVEAAQTGSADGELVFLNLVYDIATSDAYRHRREETL